MSTFFIVHKFHLSFTDISLGLFAIILRKNARIWTWQMLPNMVSWGRVYANDRTGTSN